MFKKIVLLLLGVYIPLTMGMTKDEMESLAKELHDTCVGKTGVSEDLIAAVNNDKVFADDENLKCYMKCIMQEGGIMNDEGIVDVETTIEVIPAEYKEHFEPIIRSCGTKKGKTPCENAWLTQKCYSESPQYHLM